MDRQDESFNEKYTNAHMCITMYKVLRSSDCVVQSFGIHSVELAFYLV